MICEVDIDEAFVLAADKFGPCDAIYYDVAEHEGQYYWSVLIDSDTGHFCQNLYEDQGPYFSEMSALGDAREYCADWFTSNGYKLEDIEGLD